MLGRIQTDELQYLAVKLMIMKYGLFITLEGGEGSGKSTQARYLTQRLKRRHIPAISIREPGSTPLGNRLRRLLKYSEIALAYEAELLLFNASRLQLVSDVIRPALRRGEVVICDRFADSTLAYQGYGRGLSLEIVEQINEVGTQNVLPDLTILLDVAPEKGLQRHEVSNDRYESGHRLDDIMDFHRRVRDGYLSLSLEQPERWLKIDGTLPATEVSKIIWRRVNDLLSGNS